MKIFVIMLLFTNLTGWGWVVWHQREIVVPLPRLSGLTFVSARHELQLLDITRASERGVPVVMAGVAELATGPDGLSLPEGGGPGMESLAEAAPGRWCGLTAAFQEEKEAISWLSDWVRLGGQGGVVEKDEPVSSTWWVHLAPFPTESDARVVLSELQGKKIDSFYMRTGELAGGISLGVFSRKESAFLVQADIEKRGYPASVREIQRMAKRFNVALELRERALLQTPQLQELLRRQNTGEVSEMPCR